MTYDEMSPTRLDLTGSFGLRVADRDVAEVRVGTLGRWGQRVNLATNPSFEALTGASVVVRTNLFPDPRAVVRANPHWQPRYAGEWSPSGVTGVTDHPLSLTTAARITATVEVLGGTRGFDHGANVELGVQATNTMYPVTAGTTYIFSAWVRSSAAGRGARMRARFSDGTAWVEAIQSTATINLQAGVWTLITYTGTVPTGASRAAFSTSVEPGAAGAYVIGETFDATGVYIGIPGDYFDGDTSPDPDLTPAWTGPVNGSTSTLSGRRVAGVDGGIAWRGGVRMLEDGTITDDMAVLDPARTYEVSADIDGVRGPLDPHALQAGRHYDRLLIEDATDAAPGDDDYWDGDTPNTARALHHWTGPRHGSTSVQTLAWSPGD